MRAVRRAQSSRSCDLLSSSQVLEPSAAGNGAPEGSEQAERLVRAAVAAAREVAARGVLLRVAFASLFEYLTVRAAHAAKLLWSRRCACAVHPGPGYLGQQRRGVMPIPA